MNNNINYIGIVPVTIIIIITESLTTLLYIHATKHLRVVPLESSST